MSHRSGLARLTSLLGLLAGMATLPGCTLSRNVRFTNASDLWLNVAFFTAPTDKVGSDGIALYRRQRIQVAPGETAQYKPDGKLIHLQVDAVAPSWEPPARRYWLELLTHPEAHIVATCRSDKLEFITAAGEVAMVPEREIQAGRFAYRESDGLGTDDAPKTPSTAPAQAAEAPSSPGDR